MSIITVKCTCGRELTIDIKTIDTLTAERNQLRRELHNVKARLSALEMNNRTNESLNIFNDIFGSNL